MEIGVYNGGADLTLVFASEKDYKRSNITSYLPKLADMLSTIRDMELFSDEFMSYFNNIIDYIRNALQPELKYVGEINSGNSIYYPDYTAPKFIYTISMINPTNMTVSVNKLNVFKSHAMKDVSILNSLLIKLYDAGSTSLSEKISGIFASYRMGTGPVDPLIYSPDEIVSSGNTGTGPINPLSYNPDEIVISRNMGTGPVTSISNENHTMTNIGEVVIYFPMQQHPYRRIEIDTKNLRVNLLKAYKSYVENVEEASDKSNSSWKKTIIFLIILVIIVAAVGILCGGAFTLSKQGNQYEERHITNVNYA